MYVESTTLKWVILSSTNQEIPNRVIIVHKCFLLEVYRFHSSLRYFQISVVSKPFPHTLPLE